MASFEVAPELGSRSHSSRNRLHGGRSLRLADGVQTDGLTDLLVTIDNTMICLNSTLVWRPSCGFPYPLTITGGIVTFCTAPCGRIWLGEACRSSGRNLSSRRTLPFPKGMGPRRYIRSPGMTVLLAGIRIKRFVAACMMLVMISPSGNPRFYGSRPSGGQF